MGEGATQVFGIPETGRPEFIYFCILVAFSGNFCGLDKLYLAKLGLWRFLDDPEDAKFRTQLCFACIGRIKSGGACGLWSFTSILYTFSFNHLSERKPSCTGWFLHAGLFFD